MPGPMYLNAVTRKHIVTTTAVRLIPTVSAI